MDAEQTISLPTERMKARIEGSIGWMIFNNPDRRNAVSSEMWEAVPLILDRFEADPSGAHHRAARRRRPRIRGRSRHQPVRKEPLHA